MRSVVLAALLAACSVSLEIPSATATPTQLIDALLSSPTPLGQSPDATPRPPVDWLREGLSGRLLLILFQQGPMELAELDMQTGELEILYTFDDNVYVSAAVYSPDGNEILLSYDQPGEESNVGDGFLGLYILPADGSGPPQPLLDLSEQGETLFFPAWSPDGSFIYYSHVFSDGGQTHYVLERMAYPGGEPEVIVENAFWPGVSPDGETVAYITWNAGGQNNELFLANSDGGNPRPALDGSRFPIVDAPMFSRDGRSILFSAPSFAPSGSSSFFDRLLGVRHAAAHSVPSDWWAVDVQSGEAKQLTTIFASSLYGGYSPDGRYIASLSSFGLFVMQADGSGQFFIPLDVIASGTLDWVP
jgi:Tol biopolymer transport system component